MDNNREIPDVEKSKEWVKAYAQKINEEYPSSNWDGYDLEVTYDVLMEAAKDWLEKEEPFSNEYQFFKY